MLWVRLFREEGYAPRVRRASAAFGQWNTCFTKLFNVEQIRQSLNGNIPMYYRLRTEGGSHDERFTTPGSASR